VQIHVDEATRYWKERAAEERKEERRKKANDAIPVADVGSECDPNYLGTNLSDISSEEKDQPIKVSTALSNGYATKDDEQHVPFPSPSSEKELAETISTLFADCALSSLTMSRMRTLLATGKLTPAIVQGQRSDAA
jgi:hypothetical protein